MNPDLPPHIRAAVRSEALARTVADVLAHVPRAVDATVGKHQALPLVVPEGVPLPEVPTLGPWSLPVDVGERRARVAAVRARVARELAARRDRRAAAQLATDVPAGCVWALYLDRGNACAVLALRPVCEVRL